MKKTLLLFVWAFTFGNVIFILNSGCYKPASLCHNFLNVSITAWNNADSMPHAADEGGVVATTFYLQLTFVDSQVICFSTMSVPFVNTASAYTDNFQTVDSVAITSNNNFDPVHPAGTILNDLFYRRKNSSRDGIYYLVKAPADTSTHSFTARVFIKNPDKTLIAVTPPIKLLP